MVYLLLTVNYYLMIMPFYFVAVNITLLVYTLSSALRNQKDNVVVSEVLGVVSRASVGRLV